jgi:hypothetical protein
MTTVLDSSEWQAALWFGRVPMGELSSGGAFRKMKHSSGNNSPLTISGRLCGSEQERHVDSE